MRCTSWRGPLEWYYDDPETEKEVCQEILNSLKEHLQHRWDPTQLEEPGWSSASASRSDPQSKFQLRTQVTSNHFRNRWQESCKENLRLASDAHCQALVATTLLGGHIERLNHSVSHGWSGNCGWLGSHQHSHSGGWSRSCRRHPLAGDKEQVPSVAGHTGDSVKRWVPSPSPDRLRRWVTFGEHGTEWDTSVWEVPF